MEPKYQMLNNGQEVQQADLNTLGDSSGLADDRTLAELVRLVGVDGSSNIARGIMPYGVTIPGFAGALPPNFGVIAPNGGTGSVKVYPFRAFVGSRTIVGTDAKANWRDSRSTIAIAAATAFQPVTIPANASGNPRWDLVYATITPDANGATFSRFVKDPTTGAEGAQNLVTTLVTTVALGETTGLPGVNPGFPATPSDGGGSYVIPLAYVRVPNGFGAGSTVGVNDIFEVAPIVSLAPASGGARVGPANGLNTAAGSLQARTPWPASGNRTGPYLPSTMVGCESRFFGIDLLSATKSINSGDIIDSSIDWRFRAFRWFATAQNNALTKFAYDPSHAGTNIVLDDFSTIALGNQTTFGFGQSFLVDAAPEAYVAFLVNARMTQIAAATNIRISVDMTTGALKVFYSGAPAVMLFIWIDATGSFPNT
ncbi:MAG TPA: hypothetical protein VFT22_18920 [Kofleriaceae bacterium]|nr:hypothetical protein [Kofleriaceae bacterium]